ncbi:MAG TPA: MurT ligase domain-containing protein [Methanobacteriaceae archaeon]|nr:MurT ligase domain-containing protein [Methanobacteriaceae archaeon]
MAIYPDILKVVNQRCQRKVIITGTNGKTTTNNLLTHVTKGQYSVLSNLRGANMPQGLVSAFLNDLNSNYDWGVFEVDEGSFERVVQDIKPDYVVITNFFRDQLDRYGEIEKAFQDIFESLEPLDTTLILNADDPLVSNFQKMRKRSVYYGVGENQFSNQDQIVVETNFCPSCNSRLNYTYFNYGQLGKYHCMKCGFKNPPYQYQITSIEYRDPGYNFEFQAGERLNKVSFQYEGIYNAYNCCAAMTAALEMGMNPNLVMDRIGSFEYFLGRMENFDINGKNVKVALVKNPIGLGEVLKTLSLEENAKNLLMILNDNAADSTDVSWIWDAEVEAIKNVKNLKSINFSGKRPYDMALRFKYTGISTENFKVEENMDLALERVLNEEVKTVYILPTYTAVFQVRELLNARIKGKGKFMSHFRESLKNLKLP